MGQLTPAPGAPAPQGQMGLIDRLLLGLLGKDTGAAPAGPQDQALLNLLGDQQIRQPETPDAAFRRLQAEQQVGQPTQPAPADPGIIQRILGSLGR